MRALPLADDLFLIGHDEYNGRARTNDVDLDAGLAGAVLAELVLLGWIRVADNSGIVVRHYQNGRDQVQDAAMAMIMDQPSTHSALSWVDYLRGYVRDPVVARLSSAGLIRPRAGLKVRYPATDPTRAAAPQARLRFALDHPSDVDDHTALLAGLVMATNVAYVLAGSPREVRDGLARMYHTLPTGLRAIIAAVETAISRVTLHPAGPHNNS
jgi:hypothetical protein